MALRGLRARVRYHIVSTNTPGNSSRGWNSAWRCDQRRYASRALE